MESATNSRRSADVWKIRSEMDKRNIRTVSVYCSCVVEIIALLFSNQFLHI